MLKIRAAGIEDMATVRMLACKIWPIAYGTILEKAQLDYMLDKIYSFSSLTHQLTFLKHHFILVLENEDAIGFASFSAHEDAKVYHLNKIYVLPQQQGKNVGKHLLDYVIKQIKKTGATSLQLNVNRHNRALHFYEKQGFTIVREEDIDIGEGYFMNDYVMELKL